MRCYCGFTKSSRFSFVSAQELVVVVTPEAFIDSTKPLLWLDVNTESILETPCRGYVVKQASIHVGQTLRKWPGERKKKSVCVSERWDKAKRLHPRAGARESPLLPDHITSKSVAHLWRICGACMALSSSAFFYFIRKFFSHSRNPYNP